MNDTRSSRRPLAVDLFCGSFGWSGGWLELGGRVVGYDIDHQSHHGPVPRGADLVLQDVRTIDGARFKDASLILASPPCTEFSYMAMPWARAKQIAAGLKGEGDFPAGYAGSRTVAELTDLFDACFRIQREAIAAAGHFIPMVIENVRGAQAWVGRSRWHHGSFHLWADVPALMPITSRAVKVETMGAGWYPPGHPKHVRGLGFNTHAERQMKATKNAGGSWFNVNTTSGKGRNPDGRKTTGHVNQRDGHDHTRHLTNQDEHDGVKGFPSSAVTPLGQNQMARAHSSKSNARKAASAQIARIPLALARHIARAYFPIGGSR